MFKGYVDHCKNTDNAWVENTVLNVHLDRRSPVITDINDTVRPTSTLSISKQNPCGCLISCCSIPQVASGYNVLQWHELSGKSRLMTEHQDSLRRVAAQHNRKFWCSSFSFRGLSADFLTLKKRQREKYQALLKWYYAATICTNAKGHLNMHVLPKTLW